MAKSKYPTQLLVLCAQCRGARTVGCPGCNGFGRVPGLCALCGGAAFHRTTIDIRCPGCYYRCELCLKPTDEADRLAGTVPHTFLHAFCALSRQILENTVNTDNTGARARECADERAHARAEDTMPRPGPNLLAAMRQDGYISTSEAATLTGHGLSTIYDWIATGRLREHTRSGQLIFIKLEELEARCPQVRQARRAVSQ